MNELSLLLSVQTQIRNVENKCCEKYWAKSGIGVCLQNVSSFVPLHSFVLLVVCTLQVDSNPSYNSLSWHHHSPITLWLPATLACRTIIFNIYLQKM